MRTFFNRKDISYWTVWFLIVTITWFHFTNSRLKNGYFTNEIGWDVTTYYLYLPYTFIYHDIGITHHETIDHIFEKYKPSPSQYQIHQLPNGKWALNYTCGFAYLQAPFFFIGHLWALNSNYPADGFSFPYQFSVANGVMIYIFLGLFFLRKVLLRFFSPTVSSLTMLMMVLGTNYFQEAYNDYLQPHAMLFAANAILLYLVIKWHEELKKKFMVLAGLLMGWMILARPSEIVCILIPLLWNVYDKESFRKKIELIKTHASHIGLLLLFAFIAFIPQFIYWKIVTGSWIYYSYAFTESFDFDSPYILNVLFSFKSSLLIFSPVLIFSFGGFFLMRKYNRQIFFAVFIYFLVNFYLLASWPGWWNTRYFVQSYAAASIPFGYLLFDLNKRKLYLKILAGVFLVFFFFMGLFQTWQFQKYILPFQRVNFEYYKRVFLKTKATPEDAKYLDIARGYSAVEEFTNENEYDHFTIAHYNFENINSTIVDVSKIDSTYSLSAPYSYKMGENDDYGITFKIRYDHLVPAGKDHAWLRVTVNYFSETDIKDNPATLVIEMPHKKYSLKYASYDFEKFPSKTGKWNQVQINYLTPAVYSEKDNMVFYLWHRGKKNIYFDDFHIEAFERKFQ